MATQPTDPGAHANAAALAAEEAERLASQFRPSWDTDDAAPIGHDPAASTLVSPAMAAPIEPIHAAPVIAAPPPAAPAPVVRRAIGGSRTMLGIAPPHAHEPPPPPVPDLEPAPQSTNGQATAAIAAGPVLPPKAQAFVVSDEPSIVVNEPPKPAPAPVAVVAAPVRDAPVAARPVVVQAPIADEDEYVVPKPASKKGIVIGAVAFAALIVLVAGVKVALKSGDSDAPANAPTATATATAPPAETTAAAPAPDTATPPPPDPKPIEKPKKVAADPPVAVIPPPPAMPPQPVAPRDPKPSGKTDSGKKSPKSGGGSIVRDVPF